MSDLKAFTSKTKIASDDCNTHSGPRSVAKVRNYKTCGLKDGVDQKSLKEIIY